MTSKIVDVLTKILEGLGKNSSLDEVGKKLFNNPEYDHQVLNAAFALLYDKILFRINQKKDNEEDTKGVRFLSQEEKDLLGTENFNYLLHLLNLGLIDSKNLEIILNQITLFPDLNVTRKDINWIILLSFIDHSSDLLPGSRIHLYTSDTVN